jgi:large subunit ribosomal protein L15
MDLSKLKPAEGARKKRKRVGRGEGSGLGVTAGRGNKGYGSRSGSKKRSWFEGGQMPIQRRLPKFGFTNIHKKEFQVINVGDLGKIKKSDNITLDVLYENGLIRKKHIPVKLLGEGKLNSKTTIKVHAVSKTAREKIEKLGGSVILL